MRNITATDAARRFSDLLDTVEHDGESYTVVRNGRPVARIEPTPGSTGQALLDLLDAHTVDEEWRREVAQLRADLVLRESDWHD